jgi:hypothetical protein
LAVSIAALSSLAAPAVAEDTPAKGGIDLRSIQMTTASDMVVEPVPVRVDANILLSRIARNLEKSGAGAKLAYLAHQNIAGVPQDPATFGAGETLARATKSAVKSILKDFAEQRTGIGDVVDRVQDASSGGPATVTPTGGMKARFQVGVSRFLPRLDVRLNNGAVATRITVTAYGNLGIDLAPIKSSRLAFHAGYDKSSDTADVRCLVRF